MRSYGSCNGVILRLFYDISSVIIFFKRLFVAGNRFDSLQEVVHRFQNISWKIALIHLLARSHLWHGVRFQTIKR